MNQRLIWNFEFAPSTVTLSSNNLEQQEPEPIKWEARFFWPTDEIIVLNTIDNSLLDIAHYRQKHHDDEYYLLASEHYNIKQRHNKLVYKPLIKKTPYAFGFGAKIILTDLQETQQSHSPDELTLHKIALRAAQEGKEVRVKKTAFIYKFATTPTIKFELARLELHDTIYHSACIEGKSQILVERIAELLLGKRNACDYVTFLKNSAA